MKIKVVLGIAIVIATLPGDVLAAEETTATLTPQVWRVAVTIEDPAVAK